MNEYWLPKISSKVLSYLHGRKEDGVAQFILNTRAGRTFKKTFSAPNANLVFKSKILAGQSLLKRFDVVQAHDQFALPAAIALARVHGARLVTDLVEITDLHERSGSAIRNTPWIGKRLVDIQTRQGIMASDAVFTVSQALAEYFSYQFEHKNIKILRNFRMRAEHVGTPLARERLKLDFGIPQDVSLIAYINTFAPSFGLEKALVALSRLPGRYHLVLVGRYTNENYRNEIQTLIRELRLDHRVHHTGCFSSRKFLQVLSAADIGLCLIEPKVKNLKFSLPNRITDFIMAGVPILTSDIADPSKIVSNHRLGLVSDNAVDDICNKIPIVYRDRDVFRKNVARAAAGQLNWEEESRAYLDEIGNLVRESSRFLLQKQNASSYQGQICILARKPIETNLRILRQVQALETAGYDVTVIANSLPNMVNAAGLNCHFDTADQLAGTAVAPR